DSVILLGPWGGTLDNAGEAVELDRPEELDAVGVGYVLVDRIDYDNTNPWPRLGDTGMSLHRVEPVAYGDFATSWMVAAPSPGSGGGPGRPGDFNGDGVVEFADIDQLCLAIRQGLQDLALDLNGDQT